MGVRIRNVETPPGGAPEWVRNAWIGVILTVEDPVPGIQLGINGTSPKNLDGYEVSAPAAIEALKATNPQAAEYWEISGIGEARLVFNKSVCEVVPEEPKNT